MYPLPHYRWNALVLFFVLFVFFGFDDAFLGCVVYCMVVLWEVEVLMVWVVLWGVEVHRMGVERVWLEVSELGLFSLEPPRNDEVSLQGVRGEMVKYVLSMKVC